MVAGSKPANSHRPEANASFPHGPHASMLPSPPGMTCSRHSPSAAAQTPAEAAKVDKAKPQEAAAAPVAAIPSAVAGAVVPGGPQAADSGAISGSAAGLVLRPGAIDQTTFRARMEALNRADPALGLATARPPIAKPAAKPLAKKKAPAKAAQGKRAHA